MDGDDDAPPGVPEWVVTYGDMMSLLLTFFIMLVSMSQLKEDGKMREMLTALRQRFGPAEAAAGAPGPTAADRNARPHAAADGSSRSGGVSAASAAGPQTTGAFSGAVPREEEAPPALAGPAAFGAFSAELVPESAAVLDALAAAVRRTGGEVIVRGHASPAPPPPGSPHADAWDLARARAGAVAAALAERGVDPGRIRTESAGATEPPAVPDPGFAAGPPRAWDRVDVRLGEN